MCTPTSSPERPPSSCSGARSEPTTSPPRPHRADRTRSNAGYQFVRVEGYVSPRPTDIAIDLHSNLGANHYMDTHGSLLKTGHIDATTQTRTETRSGRLSRRRADVPRGCEWDHHRRHPGAHLWCRRQVDRPEQPHRLLVSNSIRKLEKSCLTRRPHGFNCTSRSRTAAGTRSRSPGTLWGPRGSPQDCPSSKPASGRDDHGVRHEGSPTRARRHCPGRL
jgi:hypothetical protein